MAISSTKSWWLKSRVLLCSRVSVSFVFVYPPQQWNQHLLDQNVRKSRRLTLPTPSLVILSLFSSAYSTNSGVAYSSMPHDSLPAYGTTAPSRPAQQTPQTLRSSMAYLVFQTHFQPELQLHSTDCKCPVTLDLPNCRSFFLAIPPQIFERGDNDTEPVQTA